MASTPNPEPAREHDPDARGIAATYLATFAGNLGPEPAEMMPSDFVLNDGSGWRRAHRGPSVDDLRLAFGPGPAMSLYFLNEDGHGHVAAVDVDGDGAGERALRIARVAIAWGAPPTVVDVSRSGVHLWWSLTRRLPAVALRRALQALVQEAALADDRTVELRPTGEHGMGGCLRAPGTRSPKDGKRSQLVDPVTGAPLPTRLAEVLALLSQVDADRWLEIGERYRPPAPPPPRAPDPMGSRFEAAVPVSAVLQRDFGVERAGPGRTVRCPVHDDRAASLSIARDDRRAWCHAPACELHRDGHGVSAWDLARLAGVPA
jgi:hypothetical protein